MNLELERRFLVNTEEGWLYKKARTLIEKLSTQKFSYQQGYLHEQKPTTRVRLEGSGKTAALCIKGKKSISGAPEFEYQIPYADGIELFLMCGDRNVQKTRHIIPYGKFTLEVDIFTSLHGLIIAEVEKPEGVTEEQFKSHNFVEELPWLQKEITGIKGWSNFSLASSQKIPQIKI